MGQKGLLPVGRIKLTSGLIHSLLDGPANLLLHLMCRRPGEGHNQKLIHVQRGIRVRQHTDDALH